MNKLVALVGAVLALVLSVQLLQTSLPRYLPRDWQNAHEYDALSDWRMARLYRQNVNPYDAQGLALMQQPAIGHQPTTPFWYLPAIDYPKATAAEFSSLLFLFLLPLHLYICAKVLGWPLPSIVAALTTSLVLSTTWSLYHFEVIQFSLPIAFLYLMAWLSLRRDRDVLAGLFLGMALTIKLFPGLMVILLLVSRRFRAVLACGLTFGIVAAIMGHVYGLDSWLLFFRQQKPIAEEWLGSLQNSSLSGLVTQLLYPFCKTVARPSRLASAITALVGAGLLLIAIWLSLRHLRRARSSHPSAIDLPFALFTLLSVFLNPWAWEHYYIFLLAPLFVLTTTFWQFARRTLRDWCDEEVATDALLRAALVSVFASGGFAVVLKALSLDIWNKNRYLSVWNARALPSAHQRLHELQAYNFAPWILLILLSYLALVITRRHAPPAP